MNEPTDPPANDLVVLTGGGGGMANATVRRLGRERHEFLLLDNSAERLDRAIAALRGDGFEVDGAIVDVSDRDSVAEAADRARGLAPLGTLVHTAGLSAPMAESRRIFEVNLLGTANLLDAFLPLARDGSAAICIASVGGHRGFVDAHEELLSEPRDPRFMDRLAAAGLLDMGTSHAYALSKRGVMILCQRRAFDWGERGGRVVSISPGLIADTDMGAQAAGGAAGAYVAKSAVGRAGSAADVAEVIAFLASSGATFISGTDILLDGGVHAGIKWRWDEASRREWNREQDAA